MSAAELFGDAGKKAGMEIWRIEKLKPVKQAPETYGTFFAGDSYICLHTKVRKDNSYEWNIHFWLGNDSTKDEQGAAAVLTVDLDDLLGGVPVQHREVQGHESSMFVSYFKNGLKISEGGVESAFNHVVPDQYKPRLFHLKGKRDVRVRQVPLSRDSLNEGDVFILDAGLELYQWNGKQANKYEKFRGLELVTQIKNTERGGRPNVHFLDQGVNDSGVTDGEAEPFWRLLGGFGSVKPATSDDDSDAIIGTPSLWKISDSTGKLVTEKIAVKKFERSMLDTNDVFMIDTTTELFLWIGKLSTKNEKKKSMEYALEYLKKNKRPEWCPITRINEKAETPLFKSFFSTWDPPIKFDADVKRPIRDGQKKSDYSALYKTNKPEDEPVLDDGTGTTTIWRVENMKLESVPTETYGQFYAGDSYVVLYEYEVKGRPYQMLYFWQGRDSSTDEKAASAILTVQMDDELSAQGKDPTQVRIVMGKEPSHFLSIFKGKFVVHSGGIASGFKNRKDKDSYDTDGVGLYHVKGTTVKNTRAIQVPEKAISLNSLDVFVLVIPKTVFVWYGNGSTSIERGYSDQIAQLLAGKRKIETIEEGKEPILFWDSLGGKTEYSHVKEIGNVDREPRLFVGTNKTGSFVLSELFNFTQEDLDSEDVFLLDCFNEVYVWIGSESNATERRESFQAALQFIKEATDGRDPDTPVYKVDEGQEPPLFTMHFLGWDDSLHSVNQEDPYLAKLKILKGEAAVQKITSIQQVSEYLDPAKNKFSLADIQKGLKKVDPARKQEYLTEEEFKKVFGITSTEFKALPAWKQKSLRQKNKLF